MNKIALVIVFTLSLVMFFMTTIRERKSSELLDVSIIMTQAHAGGESDRKFKKVTCKELSGGIMEMKCSGSGDKVCECSRGN